MKRFVYTILVFIAIPLILLVGIYLWTDPFRCLHDFDINDVDATNREYLSTELFLRNEPVYHYNSFIFASSRGGGMNTYQWKQYLPEGAQPFLFQAWGESLTGVEMKLEYLSDHQVHLDNALILIDIPGTFAENQLPHEALSIKHYMFTGQSKFEYNVIQYWNFIQKPSFWVSSVKKRVRGVRFPCESDTITNDWNSDNRFNYSELPMQDSLLNCSELSRRSFIEKWNRNIGKLSVSAPLITDAYKKQLRHVLAIFEANNTDYHLIITPTPCYIEPTINPSDLELLQEIFGEGRVHNYTGKNKFTEDYNNFSDPLHFGLRIGYLMVEDIYGKVNIEE